MKISVIDATKRFGDFAALNQVNLEVHSGELLALLGPSGSGKTTLLRIVAGLDWPDEGQVQFDGEDALSRTAGQRHVGFVFQHYALFRHMTVFENVAFGLRAKPRPERPSEPDIRRRVEKLLDLVQLGWLAQRYPSQLSGGQRQRIALARALAIEPKIVLLDEPFSALDKNLRLDMQIEIKGLLKAYGLTSIIVTHDQEEALSMADRIVVLNRGRVEQVDTPERLYDRPANLFVNRFVGYTNMLDGRVIRSSEVTASIDLGQGAVVEVANRGRLPAGRSVVISIRPENLAIAPADAIGAIPATVHLTLPLGPTEVVEARIGGGTPIKLTRPHTPSTTPLAAGAAIHVAIADAQGVSVFAADEATPKVIEGP